MDNIKLSDEAKKKLEEDRKIALHNVANVSWVKKLNLSNEDLHKYAILLEDLNNSKQIFEKEHSIEECEQRVKGVVMILVIHPSGRLDKGFKNCSCIERWNQVNNFKSKYLIHHFPDDLFNLNWSLDIEKSVERQKIVNYFNGIFSGLNEKGLYLFGAPGVGKTHLTIAATNELAKMGKTVAHVFVPKLVTDIRSTFKEITNKDHDEIVDVITNVDVLVLDDIGGETVLPWFRDEKLFPILNYRMQNKLLTFFTSNMSYDELLSYYSKEDRLKAIRTIERIKSLSVIAHLEGKNKRY